MSFTVEHVLLDPAAGERLAGFEVELPAAGEQGDLHVVRIGGRVAGRSSAPGGRGRLPRTPDPDRAGAGRAPRRGRRRPDVDATAERRGRRWWAGRAARGRRARAARGARRGRARAGRDAQVAPGAPALRVRGQVQPLVLSSLGRSGSTWLMKMFAAHPEIVTMRRFPYESSPGKYWMHAMKVLSDPANLELSAHPDSFHSDRWWAGSNPYFDASGDRRSRARGVAGAGARRAPGAVLSGDRRAVVPDRRDAARARRRHATSPRSTCGPTSSRC